MPRSRKTARRPRLNPESNPVPARPDPAAAHARALLAACGQASDDTPGDTSDNTSDNTSDHGPGTPQIADRAGAPSPALEWARSGAMALTGPADGPARFIPGALASAARGVELALCALVPGTPFARLDAPALLGERAALLGLERRGEQSAGGSARLLATRDGHLVLNLARDEDARLVPAWLEIDVNHGASKGDSAAIARVVAMRDTNSLVARGRLMGLALAPAPKSIPRDPALFRLHHPSERSPLRRDRAIRLLDLSGLWAGPLATSLLARTGIEVLKIEDPSRPDGARAGSRAFFDLMNGGKQGCALDLRAVQDRARFERLLEHADLVVESARPRALAQLGYDAEGWVQARPGRLWTSITGYGRAHEWIAYGDDAAVAAGLAWSPEPGVRGPVFPADALADPLAGLHAAAFILSHWQQGHGGLLEIALRDVAAYAGSIPDETPLPSVLPDFVVEDDHRVAIATPRARPVRETAPPLVAPDERLLAAWTTGC